MKRRHILIALASIAVLTLVLPAVAATPSPVKVAKRALKIGKRADKRAKKAQKAATRAMKAANGPGARGATGPTGAPGTPGANGAAGQTGSPGATGANGVSHAYSASSSSSVLLNPSTETTIGTLSGVPIGKYVIQAKVRIVNQASATRSVTCTLYDGATALDSDTSSLDLIGGDFLRVVPLLGVQEKVASGDITLKCQLASGSSGDASADRPDLVAIAVDQLN